MKKDRLITDLEASGWFSDMTAGEIAHLKEGFVGGDRDANSIQLASIVIENPDSFHGGERLIDDGNCGISSYEELLGAYAEASEGYFRPDAIVEEVNEERGQFAIGFLVAGRIYALFIPGAPQFDLEINDLVNESLENTGARKRFFVLPTGDQKVAVAYIEPAVYERACQLGIIPLQEELLPEIYGDSLGDAEPASPDHLTAVLLKGRTESRS